MRRSTIHHRQDRGGRIPRHGSIRYLTDVRGIEQLSSDELDSLRPVTDRYAFRASSSYLGLIDWSDSEDPIRRLIVPSPDELCEFGTLDASDESANTKLQGLQHKYSDTAVLLVTDQCAGFCRYCFRKRLFLPGSREASRRVDEGLDYIRAHPEITDVLLTGGDPLTLPTSRLGEIIEAVREIPHIHTVRIGTKVVAFNPYRILDDHDLQAILRSHASDGGRIYVMCHFDHARELTPAAVKGIRVLRSLGVMCANQCPLTRGINDDVVTLAELFQACTDAGCPQYYIFQCRPTAGNGSFKIPLLRAFRLVSEARSRVSGLSRQARFCMSHATGKIEVVGYDDEHVYARYHRAKYPSDEGKMIVLARDDEAYWLDQFARV